MCGPGRRENGIPLGSPTSCAASFSYDALSKSDIGNGPFGGDAYKRLMHSRMYTYLLDPRAQYPNDRKHFEEQEEGRREKAISK